LAGFGAPQRISTAFASWLRYCSDVAQRKPTKFCTLFGRLLGWYRLFIHFRRLLPRNGILPGAKFTLRPPSLALSYIGSVTARHSISGREPNFVALSTRRHLYSAGRPSRWALAHILVISFSSPILSGRRLDVLSANLECMSEMCCTRLAGNTGRKNRQNSPSWHHRTTLLACIFVTKACIDNRKKIVQQQLLLHMSPQYGGLRPITG